MRRAQAEALRRPRTLIVRLQTTDDPLRMWAIHLVLNRRDIPPAFRWPANEQNEQALYVTWTADLYWFCRRHLRHKTRYQTWQGLLQKVPGSPQWHTRAHRHFVFVQPGYSLAHRSAKGLDLTVQDRAPLMTLPTNTMHADRRGPEPDRFAQTHRLLVESTMQKPDKSGKRTPHEIAARRAAIWRTFILACRSFSEGKRGAVRPGRNKTVHTTIRQPRNVMEDFKRRAAAAMA